MLTLLPDENIIFKTRSHLLVLLAWPVGLAFGWICSLQLTLFLPEEHIGRWILFAGSVFVFVGLMVFLDWWFTRFYLTNLRVMKIRGIIGKSFMAIPLSRIQDISYRFGIIGRIFRFGDLSIESAGTYGKLTFRYIPFPARVRRSIEAEIQKLKKDEPQNPSKT